MNLKQAEETSRYFVCVRSSSRLGRLRVGSVDASGRLLVYRVGSPFCAHLSSSDRVGSLEFESARAACHTSVVLVELALGPSGRLEYLCVLNILGRAMIESALLSFESARVHKFKNLENTTRLTCRT